jgi:hypothetical protein
MDDIATLRAEAREAARAEMAAQERMNALLPLDPMFDPEPVSVDTMDQWEAAWKERREASERFVALMRRIIALQADRRGG